MSKPHDDKALPDKARFFVARNRESFPKIFEISKESIGVHRI
jgi:hypothetical protein